MLSLSPIILIMGTVAIFVELFNPYGLGLRVFWGMEPPYRWVQHDVSEDSPGSMDESYVGANGKTGATLYRYGKDEDFTVYGYGFSDKYVRREDAEHLAARECR